MSEFATSEIVEKARQEVIKRKKLELANEIKFGKMKEEKCVQILHIGPYSTELESIAKMEKVMKKILSRMDFTMRYTRYGLSTESS